MKAAHRIDSLRMSADAASHGSPHHRRNHVGFIASPRVYEGDPEKSPRMGFEPEILYSSSLPAGYVSYGRRSWNVTGKATLNDFF